MKNWNKINNLQTASIVNSNQLNIPLTFQSLVDNNSIILFKHGQPNDIVCYYSYNNITWNVYTIDTSLSLNAGEKISFKCTTTTFSKTIQDYYYFSSTGYINVYGNIMSLVQGECILKYIDTIQNNYQFCNLFYKCSYIIDASNLLLPATTLAGCCYYGIFRECTNLISAPQLPATTLANSCYESMFEGCKSLTIAPQLSATTLATYCYGYMFYQCTSLTTIPLQLPATILANNCYYGMFASCTSLATSPALPANNLTDSCYRCMFKNCNNLKTFPILSATVLADNCYDCMFYGCTSLTGTLQLPAKKLPTYCYNGMFAFSNLKNAPIIKASEVGTYSCYNMFWSCNFTQPPILSATTLANYCYNYMFRNCINLSSSPQLPATILYTGCYNNMFYSCTKLKNVSVNFTDWNNGTYTQNWLQGVAEEGNFNCPSGLQYKVGTSYIPQNWNYPHFNIFDAQLNWKQGQQNSYQLKYTGSQQPIFSTIDNLPTNISMNSLGLISFNGTTSDIGIFNIKYQASTPTKTLSALINLTMNYATLQVNTNQITFNKDNIQSKAISYKSDYTPSFNIISGNLPSSVLFENSIFSYDGSMSGITEPINQNLMLYTSAAYALPISSNINLQIKEMTIPEDYVFYYSLTNTSGQYTETGNKINWPSNSYMPVATVNEGIPCLYFSKQYGSWLKIDNTNNNLPSGKHAYTLSIWCKIIYSSSNSTYNRIFTIGTQANSKNAITAYRYQQFCGGYCNHDFSSNENIYNKWVNLVQTYDGNSSTKIYINGVLKNTLNYSGVNLTYGGIGIKCDYTTTSEYNAIGYYSAARIYDRCLSTEQIAKLAQQFTILTNIQFEDQTISLPYNAEKSRSLKATCTETLTYIIISGQLPVGLSFDTSTGTFTSNGNITDITQRIFSIKAYCAGNINGVTSNITLKLYDKEAIKQILIEIGVDTSCTITLSNNQLIGNSPDGLVGNHSGIQQNYPWIYFGYAACLVDGEEWKWTSKYDLLFDASSIESIELIECGRNLTKTSDNHYSGDSCSLTMENNVISIVDNEVSSERYYFKVTFSK